MRYKVIFTWTVALMLLIPGMVLAQRGEEEFTDEFPIEDCAFKTTGTNPYFTLEIGRQLYLNNLQCVNEGECDEIEEVWITVLSRTRNITLEVDGEMKTVKTRVVEEFETADGEVKEISRNFFTECGGTQDVYYFGEEVDNYENGVIVNHDGAWLAGQNGAEPGIIMPGGAFLLGSRYFQEMAPDVAMDRAEHVDMDLEIEVPAGPFEDCVKIEETTPLDKQELSAKIYCPGIGLAIDQDLELVQISP